MTDTPVFADEHQRRVTAVYPFPFANYMAQLVLPRDLQPDEAERLCACIKLLAVEWKEA